jgi:hypothetical protein
LWLIESSVGPNLYVLLCGIQKRLVNVNSSPPVPPIPDIFGWNHPWSITLQWYVMISSNITFAVIWWNKSPYVIPCPFGTCTQNHLKLTFGWSPFCPINKCILYPVVFITSPLRWTWGIPGAGITPVPFRCKICVDENTSWKISTLFQEIGLHFVSQVRAITFLTLLAKDFFVVLCLWGALHGFLTIRWLTFKDHMGLGRVIYTIWSILVILHSKTLYDISGSLGHHWVGG